MSDFEKELKTKKTTRPYNSTNRNKPKKARQVYMETLVSQMLDDDLFDDDNYEPMQPVTIVTRKPKPKDKVIVPPKKKKTFVKDVDTDDEDEFTAPMVSSRSDNITQEDDVIQELMIKEKKAVEPAEEKISYFSQYTSSIREWDNDDDMSSKEKDVKEKIVSGKTFYNTKRVINVNPGQFMYKWGMGYFTSDTMENVIKTINKTKTWEKKFHEVCYEKVKLCADIDGYTGKNIDVCAKVTTLLTRVFHELGVYKFDDKELQFQIDSDGQNSMHMIYNSGYVFKVNNYNVNDPNRNIHDSQKEFWEYVVGYLMDHRSEYEELFYIHAKTKKDTCCFDMGVYDNFHSIRTAYSIKDSVDDGQDKNRHFKPTKSTTPKIEYYLKTTIRAKMFANDPSCEKYYNFCIFKKEPARKDIVYKTPNEKVIREAIEEKIPGVVVDSIDGCFVKFNRSSPITCTCPFSGLDHIFNGYAIAYGYGLYFFCRSTSCQEPERTPEDDKQKFRQNKKGGWGVLIKRTGYGYTNAINVLNSPIEQNNWKAKRQDIHVPYEAKELFYNDFNRLVFRIKTEVVNKNTNKPMTDDADESLAQTVFTQETQAIWKQWIKETIVRICSPSKNYFLVKTLAHKITTDTYHEPWVYVDDKVMFNTGLYFGPSDARFSLYMNGKKRGRQTIGSFIEEAYATGMIDMYDREEWIPYDARRPPRVPHTWNTFKGFAAELNGQQRLRERKVKTSDAKPLDKNTRKYKQLEKHMTTQKFNLKASEEDILDEKSYKEQIVMMQKFLDEAKKLSKDVENRDYQIRQRQEQFDNVKTEQDEATTSKYDAIKMISEIKLKLLEYEPKDECIEDEDYLDESKNKRFLDSKMYKHIRDVICNGNRKLFIWTLKYFAHMFQYPQRKPPFCLIWYGSEGGGKDCVTSWLTHLIDHDLCIKTNDMNRFTGNFNAQYENKMLSIFDEATEAKTSHVADVLKSLFGTQQDRTIEKKYKDAKNNVESFERNILLTNHRHTAPVAIGDRHWVLYELNNKVCETTEKNRQYFVDLWAESENLDAQIDAFQYFKHMDLTGFQLTDLPMTDYKQKEIEYNLDSVNQMILKMFSINSFDDEIEQLLKPHIRNLQEYQKDNYDDDNEEEIIFDVNHWSFDYEFQVNHIWALFQRFCKDQNIQDKYVGKKTTFLARIDAYKIGEKYNKKEDQIKPVYLIPKSIKPKCDMYHAKMIAKKTIKGYRFTPEILRMIVEDQLKIKVNKELLYEDDEDDEDIVDQKKQAQDKITA